MCTGVGGGRRPRFMGTSWVKSLKCKGNAVDDVYHPKDSLLRMPLLSLTSSCGSSIFQTLRDVVLLFPTLPPLSSSRRYKPSLPSPPPEPQDKPRTNTQNHYKPIPTSPLVSAAALPTLAELPEGHTSRRVVEIIFTSRWSRRGIPFTGEIEMLFRVHNPAHTVARFEEYRAAVRARSRGDDRCAADGNEMMRFHCRPSLSGVGAGIYDTGVACCAVASPEGKVVEAIRTFAGSGEAYESAGGGTGRWAMLVCRVIAGRVRNEYGPETEGESITVGDGELLVFDPPAVLPCFLIIYKI